MTPDPNPPLRLPRRAPDAHKGAFGRVLLVGGSRGMAGSVALSAHAALRAGAGLVSAAVPDRCLETVAAFHPCVMTVPLADDGTGRFDAAAADELANRLDGTTALGCGPGMTTAPGAFAVVRRLLESDNTPLVVDADGINVMAKLGWPGDASRRPGDASLRPGDPSRRPGTPRRFLVLTPHPGELSRLVGVDPSDRESQIEAAQELAGRSGAVIVVKGGPTVIVDGNDRWTNPTGNPGMATAGSGDVLTGVITSLCAQGLSATDAARLGVWVHGRAGDLVASRIGPAGMIASDLIDGVAEAIWEVQAEEEAGLRTGVDA